jgi:hypothetical protein
MALTLAAIAVVLFLVMQFGVFPLLDHLSKGRKAVEEKELTLERNRRLVARAEFDQERLRQVQERLKGLETALLESPSTSLASAEWQRLIHELAASKRIELSSSEVVRALEVSPDYELVLGRTQFRCRLDQLVDFLVAMATAPKLLSVRQLRIMSLPGDPGQKVNVDLTIGAALRADRTTETRH